MKAMKILIVEDELIIARDLQDIIKQQGHILVGTARTSDRALEILSSEPVDLALLDIYIKGENDGIWLADYINKNYAIPFLFITSHSDPKTLDQALITQPGAYLLKPFDEEDVRVSIQMAIHSYENKTKDIDKQHSEENLIIQDSIFIKEKKLFKKIPLADIQYIQADSNYSLIYTKERSYTLRVTLKDIESKLPTAQFERTHKSYIVNLQHVDAINSTYIIVSEKQLPISREAQALIIQRINKL